MILLHGVPTSSLLWRDVVDRLAPRWRVVAPDLLGYGASLAAPAKDVSVPAQATALLGLLDELGIGRAHVVGHDVGGAVAQRLAVHHRARVATLTLIDSVCYDAWPVPEARLMQLLAPLLRRGPPGWVLAAVSLGLRRGFARPEGADRLDEMLSVFDGPAGRDALLRNVAALDAGATRELAPGLPGLAVPALVLWGSRDPFLPRRLARRLAGDLPDAALHVLPDAGHFLPVDAPEECAALLAGFLARHPIRPRQPVPSGTRRKVTIVTPGPPALRQPGRGRR